ncbi:MAG: hypothetical protein ACRBEE_11565 [Arenicella sp.]
MKKAFNIVLVINLLTIAAAISLDVFGINEPFKEGGFITFFSAIQLLIVSRLSYNIYRERESSTHISFWQKPNLIWLLISMGFLFLAFDESLKIHERIDRLIHYVFNIQETGLTDRIDDLLVGLYGLIGLVVLFVYRNEMKACKAQFSLFVIGFVFLFVMVGLDVMTNRKDIVLFFFEENMAAVLHRWLSFAEDAMKLLSEAFFILGFYSIFIHVKRQ